MLKVTVISTGALGIGERRTGVRTLASLCACAAGIFHGLFGSVRPQVAICSGGLSLPLERPALAFSQKNQSSPHFSCNPSRLAQPPWLLCGKRGREEEKSLSQAQVPEGMLAAVEELSQQRGESPPPFSLDFSAADTNSSEVLH